MPTYDYQCEANGQIIEVIHSMSEPIKTWADLCEKAGIEIGDTPADAIVTRLVTGGSVNSLSSPIELTSILPK